MMRFLRLTRAVQNPSAGAHDEPELVDGGPVYLRPREVQLIEAEQGDTAVLSIDTGCGVLAMAHVMESAETVHDTILRTLKALESESQFQCELEDAVIHARSLTFDSTAADLVVVLEAMVEQLGEALSEEPSALRDRALTLAGHAARLAEVVGRQDEGSEGKAR